MFSHLGKLNKKINFFAKIFSVLSENPSKFVIHTTRIFWAIDRAFMEQGAQNDNEYIFFSPFKIK